MSSERELEASERELEAGCGCARCRATHAAEDLTRMREVVRQCVVGDSGRAIAYRSLLYAAIQHLEFIASVETPCTKGSHESHD